LLDCCRPPYLPYYAPDRRKGAISVAFVRPSVCLSVSSLRTYIANNSITQRPSVPKFGIKVPHLRCDSHTSFKVKRSKVRVTDGRGDTVSAELGGHSACYLLTQAWGNEITQVRKFVSAVKPIAIQNMAYINCVKRDIRLYAGDRWSGNSMPKTTVFCRLCNPRIQTRRIHTILVSKIAFLRKCLYLQHGRSQIQNEISHAAYRKQFLSKPLVLTEIGKRENVGLHLCFGFCSEWIQ